MNKPAHDWTQIEAEYRAGVMSLREIAKQQGISAQAIDKRAKKLGWTRDLSAKIRAKANAAVDRAAVDKAVDSKKAITETEVVEANAVAQAKIRLGHRSDIRKAREVVGSLLGEVAGLTERPDLVEELIGALSPVDEESSDAERERQRKLREALDRVTSMVGRVQSVARLSEAMKTLVALERQAWGLDDQAEKAKGPMEDLQPTEAVALMEAISAIRRARATASV